MPMPAPYFRIGDLDQTEKVMILDGGRTITIVPHGYGIDDTVLRKETFA